MMTPSMPAVHDGSIDRLSRALQDCPARFDTRNLCEAQRHLRAQDRSIDLRVREATAFRSYRELQLPSIGAIGLTLGCIESGTGYELGFRSGDELLVNIPLRGEGWVTGGAQSFRMVSGQVLLIGPSIQVAKHWAGPGQVLSLHIPLAAFDAAMGRTEGAGGIPGQPLPLYLPPITLIDHRRLQTLLGFVELLVVGVDAAARGPAPKGPLLGGAAAKHAEQLLLALLIDGLEQQAPRSADRAAPGPATAVPYYVRRVEAYVRAHAALDIGITDLATAGGVSARTLQYGFRKVHGTTPMLFLKRVRLEQARAALREATGQGRKVSEIAADIGCPNVSQFSRDYRAQFGESPSQTVSGPRQIAAGRGVPGGPTGSP